MNEMVPTRRERLGQRKNDQEPPLENLRWTTPIVGLSSRTPFVAMGGCFSASFPARRLIDPVISTNRGRVVNTRRR